MVPIVPPLSTADRVLSAGLITGPTAFISAWVLSGPSPRVLADP